MQTLDSPPVVPAKAMSHLPAISRPHSEWAKFNRTGIVLGTLIAGCHVAWAFLVVLGWAQPLMDLVFWAHMLQPVYVVKAFNAWATVTLVAITFASGYALGFLGAFLWTKLRHTP